LVRTVMKCLSGGNSSLWEDQSMINSMSDKHSASFWSTWSIEEIRSSC
jgi:hypothetical protein